MNWTKLLCDIWWHSYRQIARDFTITPYYRDVTGDVLAVVCNIAKTSRISYQNFSGVVEWPSLLSISALQQNFIEYQISVFHRISNKCKILFFVNTHPCLVRTGSLINEKWKPAIRSTTHKLNAWKVIHLIEWIRQFVVLRWFIEYWIMAQIFLNTK